MSHDLFALGIPLTEKLVRTLCVYGFLLVGLRLAGKRELGQLNPFDLVVLLLLSNTLQNAIIGSDDSLLGGIIGAGALLLLNWIVVRYLYTHPIIARLFEGDPDVLIEKGRIKNTRLKRELITTTELEAAARRQGIDGLHQVESCRLEVGGALTFVPRAPTEDERRHEDLMRQLAAIREGQRSLGARLEALEAHR